MLAVLEVVEAEVVVAGGEVVDPVVLSPEVLVLVVLVVPVVPAPEVEDEVSAALVLVDVVESALDELEGVERVERGCSVRVMEEQVPLPGFKDRRSASLGGQYKK